MSVSFLISLVISLQPQSIMLHTFQRPKEVHSIVCADSYVLQIPEVSTFTHNAQRLPVLCYLQLPEQLNSSGGEGSSRLVHVCLSRIN